MAGLNEKSGVDIPPIFKGSPNVHSKDKSFITIDYGMHTMRHEYTLCGIHNSDCIFNEIELFLREHIAKTTREQPSFT